MHVLTWLIPAVAVGGALWMALRWRSARDKLRAISARLAPDERGDVAGGVARLIARAAEEREGAEVENRRLRTILAALDDAVIVVGRRQQIITVNDAALELFPTSFATVRGRTVIEMTGDHEIATLVRHCL